MTIRYYLPTTNSKIHNIHLQLIHANGENSHFCTPLRIETVAWDAENQRPKNIYLKKHKNLNTKLDRIKSQLITFVSTKKEFPTNKSIAYQLKKWCTTPETTYPKDSFLYFVYAYINAKEGLIETSTYKRYWVFLRLLARFEGFQCKQLSIKDVNIAFIRAFIAFGEKEVYAKNTVYRTLNFVKTILRFVERQGITTKLLELEIRKTHSSRTLVTLTEKELQQIANTAVPPHLKAAQEWLLISCYTGQRFSDFMAFTKEKLTAIENKPCLEFVQQKTRKRMVLPLHPIVVRILEQNDNHFPKRLPLQDYNNAIKQIAQLALLTDSVKGNRRIGHRVSNTVTQKWKLLSSHIGRRSFATNFYGKIPTALLISATGHSTEQLFLQYINTTDKMRVLRLSGYFEC